MLTACCCSNTCRKNRNVLKKKITSKVNAAALQALICRKYVDAKPKGETVIFVVVVHNGVDSLRMFFFFFSKMVGRPDQLTRFAYCTSPVQYRHWRGHISKASFTAHSEQHNTYTASAATSPHRSAQNLCQQVMRNFTKTK